MIESRVNLMHYDGTYTFNMPIEDLYVFGDFHRPPILIEESCSKKNISPTPKPLGGAQKRARANH
jgi:hypothetical protein